MGRKGAAGKRRRASASSVAGALLRRRGLLAAAAVVAAVLLWTSVRAPLPVPSALSSSSSSSSSSAAAASSKNGAAAAGGGDAAPLFPEVVVPGVLRKHPHDGSAFTQGLELHEGRLLESTGLYGRSRVREVNRETGEVVRETLNRASHFGEGLTVFGGFAYQLTWKEGVVVLYDPETLELVAERKLPRPMRQGWGVAHTDRHLVATDGSANLYWIDAETLKVVRTLEVRVWEPEGKGEGGGPRLVPVRHLNELEVIGGLVYANVWYSPRVAVIDPETGLVVQWLDLRHTFPRSVRQSREAVLNGIAHDPNTGTLLVTGKLWPELLEVELPPPPQPWAARA